MEKTKIMTFAVAAIMVVAGFAIFGVSDDSDAALGGNCTCQGTCTCDVMTMNFYFYAESGYSVPVTSLTGEGSNAYLALADAIAKYNVNANPTVTLTAIDNPTYLDTATWYYMMNEDYGDVTSLFGLTNGTAASWSAYYYSNGSWNACAMGLGYYKSINDIASNYQTHNIALVYGNANITATLASNVVSVVDNCVEYDVSFYITGTGVTSQWISGNGSDCFTAFVDAVNDNNLGSASDNFNYTYTNQYYGYIDTFLGQAEYYDASTYTYTNWNLFVWDGTQWISAWFTLGHFTPGSDTYVDSSNSAFTMQVQYVMLYYGQWTTTPPVPSGAFPSHVC